MGSSVGSTPQISQRPLSLILIMAAVLGADRMEVMSEVAQRANFAFFKQLPVGASVRIGGRLPGEKQLTTTDGGVLSVADSANIMDGSMPGLVEVVGRKLSDSVIDAAGITPLGENVDVELWEEALKMTRLPQLRSLFEPTAIAA